MPKTRGKLNIKERELYPGARFFLAEELAPIGYTVFAEGAAPVDFDVELDSGKIQIDPLGVTTFTIGPT